MSQESIEITIRLLPSGDEFEVDLPVYFSGKQIIDEFMKDAQNLDISTHDQEGNRLEYELIVKGKKDSIHPENTLQEAGVRDGDIIFLAPKMVAG